MEEKQHVYLHGRGSPFQTLLPFKESPHCGFALRSHFIYTIQRSLSKFVLPFETKLFKVEHFIKQLHASA